MEKAGQVSRILGWEDWVLSVSFLPPDLAHPKIIYNCMSPLLHFLIIH